MLFASVRGASLAAVLLVLCAAGNAAHAQSNTSGNIVGEAAAGDTVIVNGDETGIHREIVVAKAGKYRIRSLPTGTYTVMLQHTDGTVGPASTVTLRVGSTARVQ